MQYRADFIISSVGMALTNFMGIFVFWVIFASIPTLAGWTFYELLFIYAFYLVALSPSQIIFDNFWGLRIVVQDGAFIKYYFRPLNVMFYFTAEMFDLKGLTQLVLGIVGLIYTSGQLHLQWTPLQIVLLPVMLLSSSLVMISIIVASASSAFWVIHSYPLMALAFKMREFAPYPVTIFDGLFRSIFTVFIPIAFIAFYPTQVFLRPQDASVLVYCSAFVGFITFAVAYWVWTLGINRYTGTGS
jgi:ABC-2 type transport system permease protein